MKSAIISTSIILACCIQYALSTDSIRAVAMLTRHGDRTSVGTYVNNPYNSKESCVLDGVLTPVGVRQLYQSGQNKAERYSSLKDCNSFFNPRHIYARTSAIERCIISMESFLEGFIPDSLHLVTTHKPLNENQDEFLTMSGRYCKKYDNLISMEFFSLNQSDVLEIIGNTAFIPYLEHHTGQKMETILDLNLIVDVLSIQLDNGLNLPAWAVPVYYDYIKPMQSIFFKRISRVQAYQIKSGVLLNDIIERFDRFLTGIGENILFYSGHDLNLSSQMVLLDIIDQTTETPKYASVLALELHQNAAIENDMEIKIFYFRNHADEDPINAVIPQCSAPCAFNKFKLLVKSRLIKNYDETCENNDLTTYKSDLSNVINAIYNPI